MSRERFAKAFPALLAADDLTDGDKVVYLAIRIHSDFKTGANCYPSLQLIADTCGKQRSVVIRHIAHLIDKGWLTRTARANDKGQTSSLYAFPKLNSARPKETAKSGRGVVANCGHDQSHTTRPDPPHVQLPADPVDPEERYAHTDTSDPYDPETRAQIDAIHLRIVAHGERIASRQAKQRQQFAIAQRRAKESQ